MRSRPERPLISAFSLSQSWEDNNDIFRVCIYMTSYIMLCPNCYTHFIRPPPPTHTHTHTHTVTKTYKNNKYVESIRYRKICCTITNIEYNPLSTPKLLLGFWTIGPSDYWAFGLSGLWTIGPSDYRAVGLLSRHPPNTHKRKLQE